MKKFLREAGEAFLIAAGVVMLDDGAELLTAVGTGDQLLVGAVAIARASVAAGFRAVLPRLLALRARSEA